MKKEFKPAYIDGKRSVKDNIKLLNKIYEIDNKLNDTEYCWKCN